MTLKVLPLGTRGFIPSLGRQTMSFCLLDDSAEMLLLDAGTGVARLFEPRIAGLLSGKSQINIILSHYHLDHVAGLPYLAGILPRRPIRLYAPGPPYVDFHPNIAIGKLLEPPLFSLSFNEFPSSTSIVPISESDPKTIAGHSMSFLRLAHDGGSMGIRIDDRIAYLTDTPVKEEYGPFVAGCQCLLHDVWMTRAEANNYPGKSMRHSVLEDVVDFSIKNGVKVLMAVHLNPNWDEKTLQSLSRQVRRKDIKIVIPREGKVYNV